MDDRISALERRILADPFNEEALNEYFRALDRIGRIQHNLALVDDNDWQSLL